MISWHRFYDPSIGRYISADPIGLAGGINLYAYVGGDPVNWVDPWGLIPKEAEYAPQYPGTPAGCTQYCSDRGLDYLSYTPNIWSKTQGTCLCQKRPCDDKYENPGHHDPSNSGPNPYNRDKSVLPENHQQLWEDSVLGEDGNRWAKIGQGKNSEYHRFSNDGNGNWHWTGSTNGVTRSGTPRRLSTNIIPRNVR